MIPRRTVALLALAAALAAGCGYRPAGTLSDSERAPRLHVTPFANRTFVPGVHTVVGAAILRRLQIDRRLPLVSEPQAEAVLTGSVNAYENEAVAYEQAEIGRRFRVRLFVIATLTDRRGGPPVTHELRGEAFYTAGSGVTGTRAAEEDAIQRAANDVATRLISVLIDDL
jgi:hypothetical protein